MSGTFDYYQRYDKLVKLISQQDAEKYPALKLILHLLEIQHDKNQQLGFDGNTYYPEADANNQFINNNRESSGGNTVSKHWVDALNEFANVPTKVAPTPVNFKDMKNQYDNLDGPQKGLASKLLTAMYIFTQGRNELSLEKALLQKQSITVTGRPARDIVNNLSLENIYKSDASSYGNNGITRASIDGTSPRQVYYYGTGEKLPFNIDKTILTQLLEDAYKQASAASTGSTNFFNTAATGTVPADSDLIFYRKMGEPTALYRKINGTETRVERGSQEFMKLKDGGNCFTTGYQGTKKDQSCYDLVTKCLKGTKIEDCKEFMKSSNWNEAVAKEDVSPDIAIDLLRKFGFSKINVEVKEIGRHLDMIEDYDSWISNLSDRYVKTGGLDANDLKSIASNTALTSYLKRMIGIVNSNPGILNKDYVGKSNLTTNPSAFATTQLGKFGLLPKQVVTASGVPTMSSVLSLQNAVMSNRNTIGMNWGIMPQGLIFQRGGGMSSGIAEVLEKAENNSEFPLKLSHLMDESFKSFITSLKSHGKDLDSSDMQHINTLIADLKEKENKLFKAAIYTDKYVRLIGALGQSDNTSVVKLDHVKDFVDRRNSYFDKVGKKQDDLFAILKALADAQQQETTEPVKPVSDYPRF